ncbi:MAG: homoserine O-succinyltransferase [Lachnospiraceae bacterium]|nr:homoserine O-succinyltransferase [Lachnospiraceae bacterium]
MPIRVQSELPAKEILERENIFVMDENRAVHQNIRPIHIAILNLMPLKEETELQLLRSLSNTPLQVEVTFVKVSSHEAKNTSMSHLNKFYVEFSDIRNQRFDGMIITGAPVEMMEFEEVDYWSELTEIMEWTNMHVTSTIYLCWAAQAGLYYHYGLPKRLLPQKMFGLFWHRVRNRKIPLVRGFDDMFLAPHSRHTEVPIEEIRKVKEITILAESDEAGMFLGMADGGRRIFVMGHPEYDRVTLDSEYHRDLEKNLPIEIPKNYYQNDDPSVKPLLMWRSHANNLYTNWLNYYVYQATPYDLMGTPDFAYVYSQLDKWEHEERKNLQE